MSNSGGSARPESADDGQALARLQAENEALRSRLHRRTSVRRWLSHALVVVSALLVVASTVAIWADRTAFNTDRFVATVEPALDDPAFYSALSDVVSEQTVEVLDLETRVANRLSQLDDDVSQVVEALGVDPQLAELLGRLDGPPLAALAPPITTALEDLVDQIVDAVITSDEFRTVLSNMVRQAHGAAVALIRGDSEQLPNVYTAEGEVRLNLIPIIVDVLRQIVDEIREFLPDVNLPDVVSNAVAEGRQQLASALQAELPDDVGQVTLMSEDTLGDVQQTAHRLDQLVWILVLLAVAALAATIAISPARRRTIAQLGVAVVIGLILGAVVIRRVRAAILAEFESPDGERAVEVLLTETLSSLRTIAILVGVVALIGAVAAVLAGRPSWLEPLWGEGTGLVGTPAGDSELGRRVAAHYDVLRLLAIGVAVAIVFVTGLELVPVLVVGALLALLLWALSELRHRAALPASSVVGDEVS